MTTGRIPRRPRPASASKADRGIDVEQRSRRTIGFIGGTGPEGRGLALRFALAGEDVVIGSRDPDRAENAARSISVAVPAGSIRGVVNADAARMSDIVFVAVKYDGEALAYAA